jgi:hypothetical protein
VTVTVTTARPEIEARPFLLDDVAVTCARPDNVAEATLIGLDDTAVAFT